MNEKVISNVSILINIFLFLIIGIILIVTPVNSLNIFHLVISISMTVLGVVSTFTSIIRKKDKSNLFNSLLTFIIGLFFLQNKDKFLVLFPILFSLYIFLITLMKIITFFVYKIINKSKGFVRMLITIIIDIIFIFLIITNPYQSIEPLTRLLGTYFILIAISNFVDFMSDVFPNNFLTVKRRFRITLPSIISVWLPYAIYTKINKVLNKEVTRVNINKNVSGKVDLEIFVCVKDSLIGTVGHADLWFDNKIYSYGNYDEDSKWMFDTIGDGVLFTVKNKRKYLKFCAEHSKKTIFAFGITLTDRQKKRIRKELDKIMSYTKEWTCPQEETDEELGDYASCLYRKTGAKFYKFNKSNYKIYCVFWSNCVKLVDDVLGASGSDILKLNGVITPGAYYYYLDNEFKKKNSNVIRKRIITNKDIIKNKGKEKATDKK